jgi:hypothetical protein
MVELKKCLARFLQKAHAGVGQSYTGMMPFEKRYSQLVLQFSHATTDSRLPDAQNARNAPKTQILPDEKCLS